MTIGFNKLLCLEVGGLVMALVSIALVAWQHWGMNRTLVIAPEQGQASWAQDDSAEGGNSRVSFEQNGVYRMQCQIGGAISYAYCNLVTELLPGGEGVDLNAYQTLDVELSYQTSLRDTLRVYLRHFHTDSEEHRFPYKVNQQVINPQPGRRSYRLHLSDFYVPSWWVFASDLPPAASGPQLTNVKHLVFSSGDTVGPRELSLTLFKATLRGKWIASDALYRALVWLWIGLAMAYMVWKGQHLRRSIQLKSAEAEQLRSLNQLLDLRSKQFEELAKHDNLTGLLNRAGIRAPLSEAISGYKRRKMPFSLLMIDLDLFKEINDSYGHAEGDRVLQDFARLVRGRCRTSDIPGRWGGEEFILICRSSSVSEARVLAEDLCRAVRETPLGQGLTISCSIGVAEIDGNGVGNLFRRVDAALYQAKEQGRDRVIVG